uniref:Septin-type G domain-containing protein n=1 Tax=Mesocestoides corti TaxID=53468 RepID=A0A5K3F8Y6_MESCO
MNKVVTNANLSPKDSIVTTKERAASSSSEMSSGKQESNISSMSKFFESDTSEKENVTRNDRLLNATGRSSVQCKTIVNVGFCKIPKEVYRKTIHRGFAFNIMLVGVTGLGKSTLLNTLFMTNVYSEENPGPSVRYYKDGNNQSVSSTTFTVSEQNVNLTVTVVDTPGFGEALDNSCCWRLLVDEINRRNAAFMEAESRVNRQTVGSGGRAGRLGVYPEPLIHACLYFIPPTGHGLRLMDLEAMRALHDKVNLIPIIAKADTMTVEECKAFKLAVQSQLLREGIRTYDFPLSAMPEVTSCAATSTTSNDVRVAEVKRLRLRQPFAVCTSSTVITKEDGTKVRCRVYPWGTVETDSLEHNDFQALKTLLMRYFMQDLIDVTYTTHHANYRTNHLLNIMQAANFSLQDGREPLSQLDAERHAHQLKLDRLVEEMNEVYVEKVREREKRLKDTEREMAEKIRQMQQQLEVDTENLAAARQAFNDERLSWEIENRDYADSVCGSTEKLEKLKKHRRGLF